jgi:ABC-type polar amino acid transport system ATPase subunit
MTVIMVTHERPLAAEFAGRMIFLADGKVVGEELNAARLAVQEKEG